MQVHIQNLRLRTIIGINDWEREKKQDIVINITFEFDGNQAASTDDINDTVDYKTMTKRIIALVEESSYYLLEKLADSILKIVMTDQRVLAATVTVAKPQALRYADSISVSCSSRREA